ncbi:hypothetical protein FM069_04285 [Pseudomonas mangiferae]|uniref:Uncharacterized protein n=1 Tax=Pseudomonas mangiferae TaxID=2593654 RepID=A0A553H3X8_9PSED|nr:hypothetical protein FM069_04285 [Pseudomonas mangiferae]
MKGTARPPHSTHATDRGKRSAQALKGRRRQGSKPDGRDSARSTGRSPRARRANAGKSNELKVSLANTIQLCPLDLVVAFC